MLKGIGISGYITLFMLAYFALLHHPQEAVRMMPLTALDRWIDFAPWAVWPYASLWLYIGAVPSMLRLRGEMWRYVLAVTVVALIGCGIFYFWPTTVPATTIDWSRWPALELIKSTDAAGNACPSLHVAYAVLSAIWMWRLLQAVQAPVWAHVTSMVWCALIIWSTMATRQHVALDVASGALLGAVVALACLRWLPGTAVAPRPPAPVE